MVDYRWNGNGSIMSNHFKSQYNNWAEPTQGHDNSQWPYGVFKDVSKFYPNVSKQAVFFQWLRSDECGQLKIDILNAPNDKKEVKLFIKNWSEDPSYISEQYVTLPYILENRDKRRWTVLGVYSDENFDKQYYVEANCCTAPDYNSNLWKIKYPSCKQKWDMYSRFKYEKVP